MIFNVILVSFYFANQYIKLNLMFIPLLTGKCLIQNLTENLNISKIKITNDDFWPDCVALV